MSTSKFWTQNSDCWIIIIHDVVLVFTSGIQKSKWRKGGKKCFKRLPRIYQVIWSLSCNWSPNSVMQWSIYSTTMMCSPFFLQDMAKALFFNSLLLLLRLKGKSHTVFVVFPLKSIIEDQIAEAKSMGIPAASAVDISEDELRAAKFQLVFGSAETVLVRRFVDILKF